MHDDPPPPANGGASEAAADLPPELLDLIVCPLGKAPLELRDAHLVCTRCGAAFKIRDGIPELVLETAVLPAGVERVEDLACAKAPASADGKD